MSCWIEELTEHGRPRVTVTPTVSEDGEAIDFDSPIQVSTIYGGIRRSIELDYEEAHWLALVILRRGYAGNHSLQARSCTDGEAD